jgi:hypothetical protein
MVINNGIPVQESFLYLYRGYHAFTRCCVSGVYQTTFTPSVDLFRKLSGFSLPSVSQPWWACSSYSTKITRIGSVMTELESSYIFMWKKFSSRMGLVEVVSVILANIWQESLPDRFYSARRTKLPFFWTLFLWMTTATLLSFGLRRAAPVRIVPLVRIPLVSRSSRSPRLMEHARLLRVGMTERQYHE